MKSRDCYWNSPTISSWFWTSNLTRSIGAAEVLDTAAETPPIKKSTIHVASSVLETQQQ